MRVSVILKLCSPVIVAGSVIFAVACEGQAAVSVENATTGSIKVHYAPDKILLALEPGESDTVAFLCDDTVRLTAKSDAGTILLDEVFKCRDLTRMERRGDRIVIQPLP